MGIAIEVLPIGPVAVASRLWRHRGRRLFTAVVKATFALQQDAAMTLLPPAPMVIEERHYRGNPVASLVHASDLALLVPKPEVVIVGSAYAGPGQTTHQTTVRLAVQRDSTIIINKRLEIIGDRRARPGATPPPPAPFDKMPIQYERAKGGMAARDNPVGVGMATDVDGFLTFPNVNLPAQGGVNPPGLGPIPSAWPHRQRKRGSLSWTAANLSPDVDVPNDFDDAYYQTAPSDQQAADIKPGDVIAIVNMHPELGLLRTYVPQLRGVALAQTAKGDRIELNLRIDTVYIEPDLMRAEIIFRGASVVEEQDLVDLRLAGAIEQPDAPFTFPDLSTVSGLVTRRSDSTTSAPNLEATAVIPEPVTSEERAAAMRSLQPQPERVGLSGTVVMEPEPAAPGPVFGPPRVSTMVIEPEEPPRSLPFDKGHLKNQPTTAPSRHATPWAIAPPDAMGIDALDDSTIDAPARESEVLDKETPEESLVSTNPTRNVDESAETPKLPHEPIEPLSRPPVSGTSNKATRTNLKQDLYKKTKK